MCDYLTVRKGFQFCVNRRAASMGSMTMNPSVGIILSIHFDSSDDSISPSFDIYRARLILVLLMSPMFFISFHYLIAITRSGIVTSAAKEKAEGDGREIRTRWLKSPARRGSSIVAGCRSISTGGYCNLSIRRNIPGRSACTNE